MVAVHLSDQDFLTFCYVYVILFANHVILGLLMITSLIFYRIHQGQHMIFEYV